MFNRFPPVEQSFISAPCGMNKEIEKKIKYEMGCYKMTSVDVYPINYTTRNEKR